MLVGAPGRDPERALRVLDVPGWGRSDERAVHVQAHGRAVVGADQVRPLAEGDGRPVHDPPARAGPVPELPGVVGGRVDDEAARVVGRVVTARHDRTVGALTAGHVRPRLDRELRRVESGRVGHVHVLAGAVEADGRVRLAECAGDAERGRGDVGAGASVAARIRRGGAARLPQAPVRKRRVGEHGLAVGRAASRARRRDGEGIGDVEGAVVVCDLQAHGVGRGRRIGVSGRLRGRVVEGTVAVEIPRVGGDRAVGIARARAVEVDGERHRAARRGRRRHRVRRLVAAAARAAGGREVGLHARRRERASVDGSLVHAARQIELVGGALGARRSRS